LKERSSLESNRACEKYRLEEFFPSPAIDRRPKLLDRQLETGVASARGLEAFTVAGPEEIESELRF
jgi:hypothetical protein